MTDLGYGRDVLAGYAGDSHLPDGHTDHHHAVSYGHDPPDPDLAASLAHPSHGRVSGNGSAAQIWAAI